MEFERDVFAGEIARLTLLVKRLKQLCNHAASLENRDEIGAMMDQAKKLEEQNKKLEEEEEVPTLTPTSFFFARTIITWSIIITHSM